MRAWESPRQRGLCVQRPRGSTGLSIFQEQNQSLPLRLLRIRCANVWKTGDLASTVHVLLLC